MTLYDVVSGFLSLMLWGTAISFTGLTIRCISVYGPEWMAKRRAKKEEEKKMQESLKDGRGLRASEMGVNCD